MNGVPVLVVVSRLLGHSNVRTTLRYAHLGNREIEAAAERVGQSIGAIMGLQTRDLRHEEPLSRHREFSRFRFLQETTRSRGSG